MHATCREVHDQHKQWGSSVRRCSSLDRPDTVYALKVFASLPLVVFEEGLDDVREGL